MTQKVYRYLILPLLSLFCLVPATGQQKKQPAKESNSLLWKISRQDAPEASYLFGTIHLICAEDYIWTKSMQERFDQTRALYLELNLEDPGLMSSAALMMMDMSGKTLKDYFKNETDYQVVARYIEDSLHQNLAMLERLKPVALYMMYTAGLAGAPCKETVSYELKLLEQAKARQKAVNGLETLEDQMSVLESIPTDTIISQLLRIARGQDQDGPDKRLINAYKNQDLNLLNKLMNEAATQGMDTGQLIEQRNRNWIAGMEKAMHAQPTFFAVGAGHLYGLIDLLRNRGFRVEAVL